MAKIGYIMATAHYEKLEADREWMQEYGCVKVIEEKWEEQMNPRSKGKAETEIIKTSE